MEIPSQTEMFSVVLDLVKDLPSFTRGEVKQLVCDSYSLTDEQQGRVTGSGVPIYQSRAGWAVTWLNDANYVERIDRATYRITPRGKEVLAMNLSSTEFSVQIRKDKKILASVDDSECDQTEETSVDEDRSPEEILDETIRMINEKLENELIDAILKIDGRPGDNFFEKLVTNLVEKMGYGEGEVTAPSNDSGIDGIIWTDKLGFDTIMIQAKRYARDHQVGRPDVQAFAGALCSTNRGVFITTSGFSRPAIEYAKSYPHATITLIDGKRLAELMIEYNIGVSEENKYYVKRMDTDYFDI